MRFLIRHRQAREASILHRLAKGEADIPTIVRAVYIGIDPRLTNAAGYSVLAHLEDLVARGIVATEGDPVIGGTYRLARFLTVIPARAGRGSASAPGRHGRSRRPRSLYFFTTLGGSFGTGATGFFTGLRLALSAAVLRSSISLEMRAALLPRSLSK